MNLLPHDKAAVSPADYHRANHADSAGLQRSLSHPGRLTAPEGPALTTAPQAVLRFWEAPLCTPFPGQRALAEARAPCTVLERLLRARVPAERPSTGNTGLGSHPKGTAKIPERHGWSQKWAQLLLPPRASVPHGAAKPPAAGTRHWEKASGAGQREHGGSPTPRRASRVLARWWRDLSSRIHLTARAAPSSLPPAAHAAAAQE